MDYKTVTYSTLTIHAGEGFRGGLNLVHSDGFIGHTVESVPWSHNCDGQLIAGGGKDQ